MIRAERFIFCLLLSLESPWCHLSESTCTESQSQKIFTSAEPAFCTVEDVLKYLCTSSWLHGVRDKATQVCAWRGEYQCNNHCPALVVRAETKRPWEQATVLHLLWSCNKPLQCCSWQFLIYSSIPREQCLIKTLPFCLRRSSGSVFSTSYEKLRACTWKLLVRLTHPGIMKLEWKWLHGDDSVGTEPA